MIPSVEEMIKQYVAAWNEKGLAEFKAAFAACWAADATYTDPNFALVKGVDGIAELANTSLEKIPVRKFHVLASPRLPPQRRPLYLEGRSTGRNQRRL